MPLSFQKKGGKLENVDILKRLQKKKCIFPSA